VVAFANSKVAEHKILVVCCWCINLSRLPVAVHPIFLCQQLSSWPRASPPCAVTHTHTHALPPGLQAAVPGRPGTTTTTTTTTRELSVQLLQSCFCTLAARSRHAVQLQASEKHPSHPCTVLHMRASDLPRRFRLRLLWSLSLISSHACTRFFFW
jgi:hypothetical protein